MLFVLVEFEKSFVSNSMCTLYLHVFVYVTAAARSNSMEDGTLPYIQPGNVNKNAQWQRIIDD